MSGGMRFALFLGIVLAIWSVQHLYVGWRVLGLPWLATGPGRRIAWWVLTAGFLLYPAARLAWHRWRLPWMPVLEWTGAAWMGTLFLLVAALLAAEVLTLGGLAGTRWSAAVRSAAVLAGLTASAAALAGGARPPALREEEVVLPRLQESLDGITAVHLSDLHLGTLLGERFLSDLVRRVAALRPDLVLLTGDVFDSEADTVEALVPLLGELRAPLGTYAVLGNHEFYAGAGRCRALLQRAGITVLDNRWVEAAPGLVVAGVPDGRGSRQTGQPGPDLEGTLADVPRDSVVVLLQHSPEAETRAAALGVDLMLDGHTHGGQIWPFHLLVRRAYPHMAGRFQVGAMVQIVSRGAGRWGPPMRLAAPADLSRLTLRTGGPRSPGAARHDKVPKQNT